MILNARHNGFLVNLPQNFFSSEIDKKYEKYYKNLLVPYRSISDFMASTIQTIEIPGFNSVLQSQIEQGGKKREVLSSLPIAEQFSRELKISFKLTDGWLSYWIFLDNLLNYLEPSNLAETNTQNSLGRAHRAPVVLEENHPFFSPIRLTILNNEGYALVSVLFNRPMITGLTNFQLSYASVKSEFKTFSVTFKYYNFDLEPEFA